MAYSPAGGSEGYNYFWKHTMNSGVKGLKFFFFLLNQIGWNI